MNCPECGASLERRNLASVIVDECVECGGIWFDRDELRRAKDAAEPDANWLDFEAWKHTDSVHGKPAGMDCPSCEVPLLELTYGDTGVEIDHCPGCWGVWLAKGRFRAIVEALDKQIDSMPAAELFQATLREARSLIEGTEENLGSDWHDFATVLRLLEYRFLVDNPSVAAALARFQGGSPFR
ncbi:MAG: hypothetical protein GKS06_07995 [Acidobacteria bacterium]|nr:hypothetical protein [Acidobacteriota bacterium]